MKVGTGIYTYDEKCVCCKVYKKIDINGICKICNKNSLEEIEK